MKIVIAPDSFKGCLTSQEVASAIAEGLSRVWPQATLIQAPMADGGEGTLHTLVEAKGGQLKEALVTGPLGNQIGAQWGVIESTAVIEMAQAAGLPLVPLDRRDPMVTTSRGVGELIRLALDLGVSRCIIGLGGSGTIDGGLGLLEALGVRFLDQDGEVVPSSGEGLVRLHSVDLSHLDPRVHETTFIAACDVASPLLGPNGAAQLYGPQKGASPQEVTLLEEGLKRLSQLMENPNVADLPGSGAAGGMGAGLAGFLHATLLSGVELIAQEIDLADRMRGADLVITGEGEIDRQTPLGKSPIGVAKIAKGIGIPVVALSGRLGEGWEAVLDRGIDAAIAISPGPLSLEESLVQAKELLVNQAYRVGLMIELGRQIQ
jgi:glycerate 2-kinase